jgi:hypothetical protein
MKILLTIATLFAITTQSNAQAGKPSYYANKPAEIAITTTPLQETLQKQVGNTVTIQLSNDFVFNGTVVRSQQRGANVQTVHVKSTEFNGNVLMINKISNADNTKTIFTGRILNADAADGYEIVNEGGSYKMKKFNTADILTDCGE